MSKRQITFGIMLQGPGDHMNAWKHASVPVDASTNIDYFARIARQAEAAGIAFAFVADGLYINEQSIPHFLNRLEPIVLLTALAGATDKLGLVGTLSTSYSDPFTVARQFGSIDILSGGRAGWNAVTSPLEGSARNYGRRQHPEHALRYEIASEHIEAVKGLWDSWDDDAFARDRATGVYANLSKMHRLNFKGKHHAVEGPLNLGRSAQGQPVLFQAGASDDGVKLAGRHADGVFTSALSLEENRDLYRRLKDSAAFYGRQREEIKIFPGIDLIVGSTEHEAERKYRALQDLVDLDEALRYLGRYFDHHDFTKYAVDEPFPELGLIGTNSFRSTTDHIKHLAREGNLTLRDVALQTVTPRSEFVGSPEKIADALEQWVDEEAADGFVLTFPVIPSGLDDFEEFVLPLLERRGRHRRSLAGNTLRDHLGLPFRESIHLAVARGPQATSENVGKCGAKDEFLYTTPLDPRAVPLIRELTFEYASRYGDDPDDDEMQRFPPENFVAPHGNFLLLVRNGTAIAGGAFMRHDDQTAELKRVWTANRYRRQGLARKVLLELESQAARQGYARIYLTTGFRQPEAAALYLSAGYRALFDTTIDPKIHVTLPFEKEIGHSAQ